ncbi:hypothetical protein ACFXPY_36745 [Streptomyces sp. NPDC059153]|uniref:hypothetical protein n=1 Tax=Streptomyces sp. NPDC059153 TaxID=3346743 RepID=UPI003675D0BE
MVVRDPLRAGADSVGFEQWSLPARAAVPPCAPGGDGEVGPAVGDAEGAEVDVADAGAVVAAQDVGRAGATVADDESADGRDVSERVECALDGTEVSEVFVPAFGAYPASRRCARRGRSG